MTRLIPLMQARHKRVCVSSVKSVWVQVPLPDLRGSSGTGGIQFEHLHESPPCLHAVSLNMYENYSKTCVIQGKKNLSFTLSSNVHTLQAEVKLGHQHQVGKGMRKAEFSRLPVLQSGLLPGRTIQILWHSIWLSIPVGYIQADLRGGKVAFVSVSPLSSNSPSFDCVPKYVFSLFPFKLLSSCVNCYVIDK